MHDVNQCTSPCTGRLQDAVYDRLQQFSHLELAAAGSERSADITIVTDEDDRVTLSVDSHVRAVALTYEDMARTRSGSVETRGELVGIHAENQIELSIQGELDEQERKEIRQVLKALFKMVKNFLSGKSGNGPEAAPKFDDLATIASVKAEFEARDTAVYLSQSVAQDVTEAQAPAETPALIPEANAESAGTPVAALADRMAEVVKQSGVDPFKVKKPVDEMFGRLLRRFLDDGPFGFRQMRRLRAIMEEFSLKIEQLMGAERPEAPALQPLPEEAVDPAAPLETVAVKKSTVQTRVSIFEQSLSFSFAYSAAEHEDRAENEVSAVA